MHDPSDRVVTPQSEAASGEGQHEVQELFARVYNELRGLAQQVRRGRAGETLNTTALVHEAYLKLAAGGATPWKNEGHFFAIAARAMRQVLVDAARRRLAGKRGGGEPLLMSYDDAMHATPIRPAELIALDEALDRLTSFDPRRAQVVEHRIFAGLSTSETATLLGISTGTVERDWRAARAWLTSELAKPDRDDTVELPAGPGE